MTTLHDTLRRTAIEPLETADLWAPFVASLGAFILFSVARHYLGRWPDLWCLRQAVLPIIDRLADGEYDEELDAVDDRVGADLDEAVDALPEKTGLRLNTRTLVGTIDAPPAEVRSMERVWPNTLASIQFDVADGDRVWEVGSYAYRPQRFFGMWQYHVRPTPAAGGRQTRLWAHYERSAWRAPVRHYRGEGWDTDRGVRNIASMFASDERFGVSERTKKLIGAE
ncbi:hypothetical protein [Halorubrum sp. AS12]|uniref:hypothetical protein n=1 Tax=Halorubrum sp. AS12 TaxID=3409687 RepID=UPI003DA75791